MHNGRLSNNVFLLFFFNKQEETNLNYYHARMLQRSVSNSH